MKSINTNDLDFFINKIRVVNSKFIVSKNLENNNINYDENRNPILVKETILNNAILDLKYFNYFHYEDIKKEGEGKNIFNIDREYENDKIHPLNGNFNVSFETDNFFRNSEEHETEEKNLVFLEEFDKNDEIVFSKKSGINIWANTNGGSLDFGNIKFKTINKNQDYNFIDTSDLNINDKKSNENGLITVLQPNYENQNWELKINGDNFKEYYGIIYSHNFPVNIANGNLENAELQIFNLNSSPNSEIFLKASARPVKIFNLKTDGKIIIDVEGDDKYTQYQVKKDAVFYHFYNEDETRNNLIVNVKDGIKLTKNKLKNVISSEDGNVLFYKEVIEQDENGKWNTHYEKSDIKIGKVIDNSLLYNFVPEYYDNHIDLRITNNLGENIGVEDEDGNESPNPNQNEPSVGNTDTTTTDTTHVDSPSQSKQLEKIIKKRGKRADLLTETNLVPYLDNLLNKAEEIEKIDETNLTEEQQLAKQAKTHFIRIENEEEVEKVVEETLPIENLLDRERVFRQLHKINSFTHRHQLQFGNQKLQKLQKLLNSCQSNQNNNWYGNLLAEKGKFGHGLNNLKTYDYGFTLGLDKVLDEGENCKDLDDRIAKPQKPQKLQKLKLDGLGFNFSVIKGTGKTEKTQFENLNFIASIYGNKILREYYDIELLSQASLGYSQSKLTNNYHFYQTQSTQKPHYLLGSLSLGLAKEFNLVETDNISLLLKPYSFLTYQALSTSSTHNKIVDETKDKLLDYSLDKHYQQTLSQEIGVMQQFMLKELTKLNLQTGLSLTFDWLNTQKASKPLYFQHKDGNQLFLNSQQGKGFKGLKTVKSFKGFLDVSYQLNPMTTINSYYQFEKGLKDNNSYQHQIGVGLEIKY